MNVVPKCIICEQVPEKGMAEGVFLNRKFICDSCEEQIATLAPEDEKYNEIVTKIRSIWKQNSIGAPEFNKRYKH